MTDIAVIENMRDPMWRLDNLYWILDDKGSEVPFRLRPAQREFLSNLHNWNLILKARQVGYTTVVSLLQLDQCLFNRGYKAVTIADTLQAATEIFRTKIAYPWLKLPEGIRNNLPLRSESSTEYVWQTGSSIGTTTSARGGSLQSLHVSEFGKICAKFPEKATEIVTGSFPAVVLDGGMIFIESTAKGQAGKFYDMAMGALRKKQANTPLTKLDFRLHFYPWWRKETNRLSTVGVDLTQANIEYFIRLGMEHQIVLDPEQKAWYVKTLETLGEDMKAEHPSFPEEAFEVAIAGAIFAKEMAMLRRNQLIGGFAWEPRKKVNTFWDLGVGRGNATAIWCHQRIQGRNRLIHYIEAEGEGLGFFVNKLNSLGYIWGTDYLPHDAQARKATIEIHSAASVLRDLGRHNQIIVPRIPFKNTAIEALRSFLMTCEIDAKGCVDGIRSLDGYQREWDEKAGRWGDQPLHNQFSNGCDALMQGAQGYEGDTEWAPIEYDDEPLDRLVGH